MKNSKGLSAQLLLAIMASEGITDYARPPKAKKTGRSKKGNSDSIEKAKEKRSRKAQKAYWDTSFSIQRNPTLKNAGKNWLAKEFAKIIERGVVL